MPQHVRRDPLRPVRQVLRRRGGQAGPQRLVAGPRRAAVGVAPLGAEQRRTRPGVIIVEAGPDVLDEPPQGRPGAVDQRHHPLPRPGPAGALADADVQLAEPAQVPLHVGEIEVADLVHAQPDIGHQPGPPHSCGRPGRTSGRSPAPPATRRTARPPAPPTAGSAAPPGPLPGAGSSHRPGIRPPCRSSGGSPPCAGSPGTGNTFSAPASGPGGCLSRHPAAPCRSTRRRQQAPCPTAGGRTTPAAAPGAARRSQGRRAVR